VLNPKKSEPKGKYIFCLKENQRGKQKAKKSAWGN